MKFVEAKGLLESVQGKSQWWLKEYGPCTIKEAIATVRNRKSATDDDLVLAEQVSTRLNYDM